MVAVCVALQFQNVNLWWNLYFWTSGTDLEGGHCDGLMTLHHLLVSITISIIHQPINQFTNLWWILFLLRALTILMDASFYSLWFLGNELSYFVAKESLRGVFNAFIRLVSSPSTSRPNLAQEDQERSSDQGRSKLVEKGGSDHLLRHYLG